MKRPWTKVTMPMRRRMRELRAAGLSAEATALVIALDFGLDVPPSRTCVEAHAPRPKDAVGHGRHGHRSRVAA